MTQNVVTQVQSTLADNPPNSVGLVDGLFFNGDGSNGLTALIRGMSAGSGVSLTLQNVPGTTNKEVVIGIAPGGPGTVTSVNAVATAPITVTGGPITTSGTFSFGILPATESQNGYLSSSDKIKLDLQSGTNTGDQTITLTGDVSGSSPPANNTIISTTLANSGVSPGTYTYSTITVDSKGRVTTAASGISPVTEFTTAANIGSGFGWFATKVGTQLQFKSLTLDTNLNVAQFSDHLELMVNVANLVTTLTPFFVTSAVVGENLGTAINGSPIFQGMSGSALTFNRIQAASSNIVITTGSPSVTIGLGSNVSLLNQPQTYTGQQVVAMQTLVTTASIMWDLNLGSTAYLSLTANASLPNPMNMIAGGVYYLIVVQDSIGSRVLNFGPAFKWSPTFTGLSTTPNAIDLLSFVCTGTLMLGSIQKNFM